MGEQRGTAERRDVIPASRRQPPWLDWLTEDWQRSRARDALTPAVLTIIAVVASYGEAHPQVPGRYFSGPYHLPHTPLAAFSLVAASGAVLAWRHDRPRLVLCASTAAVVAYSVAGWVTGAALLLPAVALGTLAAMVPARQAIGWAVATLAALAIASM